MRWAAIAIACAGCYRPGLDPNCRIQCVAGAPDNCPSGFDCIEGSCRNAAQPECPDDAMIADTPIDTAISMTDAGFCVGSDMPLQVCLGAMPMNDMMITTRTTFDTNNCASLLIHQGQTLCVYAYRTLTVRDTMRFVGIHPAVIVAVDVVIQAGGQISVAEDFTGQPGAGSDPSDCPQLVPGNSSKIASAGGGGGAGGSFGSSGGNGGNNTQGDGNGASARASVLPPYMEIRGGCSGSAGGNDGNGGSAGMAGRAGGAIAVLASNTILVNGSVLAYGGGGSGASGPHAGGGGGGAGGMILLDATTVSGAGRVNANGGGGGAGGNDVIGGANGDTVTISSTNMGGAGGPAASGAGDGGMGGAVPDASVGGSAVYGGGGGGGGGGIVLIRGVAAVANAYPRR